MAALAPATTTPPSLTSTTPTKPSLLKPPLKRASPGPHMADVASSPLLSSATSFDSCSSEGEEAIPAPSVVKKGGAARKGGASAEATGAGHAKGECPQVDLCGVSHLELELEHPFAPMAMVDGGFSPVQRPKRRFLSAVGPFSPWCGP